MPPPYRELTFDTIEEMVDQARRGGIAKGTEPAQPLMQSIENAARECAVPACRSLRWYGITGIVDYPVRKIVNLKSWSCPA